MLDVDHGRDPRTHDVDVHGAARVAVDGREGDHGLGCISARRERVSFGERGFESRSQALLRIRPSLLTQCGHGQRRGARPGRRSARLESSDPADDLGIGWRVQLGAHERRVHRRVLQRSAPIATGNEGLDHGHRHPRTQRIGDAQAPPPVHGRHVIRSIGGRARQRLDGRRVLPGTARGLAGDPLLELRGVRQMKAIEERAGVQFDGAVGCPTGDRRVEVGNV